jgi:hypothetical protein
LPRYLLQRDGGDLYAVTLDIAGNVGAEVVLFCGSLEGRDDLLVAFGIEFQELLITGDDAVPAGLALEGLCFKYE